MTIKQMSAVALFFSASAAGAEFAPTGVHGPSATVGHEGFPITLECIERILNEEVPNAHHFAITDDISGAVIQGSLAMSNLRAVYIAAANDQVHSLSYDQYSYEGSTGSFSVHYDTQGGQHEWRVLMDDNPAASPDVRAIAEEGAERVKAKVESCFPQLLG